MSRETEPRADNIEAILQQHYRYLVVDPYAVNLIDKGPRIGQARFSFYSAFMVNPTRELINTGVADQIVLFEDDSFEGEAESTGSLMKKALTKGNNPVPEDRIILFDNITLPIGNVKIDLNSTAAQALKLFLNMRSDTKLYLTWDYHRERVQNHMRGYRINAQTVDVEAVHKYFRPSFDRDRLDALLPNDEIEAMENLRRKLSKVDVWGIAPLVGKPILGGSYTLDNQRGQDGNLHFMYKPGKDRLAEVSRL